MSYAKDLQDNERAVRELTKTINSLNVKFSDLNTKFEVMSERVSTIQKLVYGLVGIILTAVIYAILNNAVGI